MPPTRLVFGLSAYAALTVAAPAFAWPDQWDPAGPPPSYGYGYRGIDPREGKVDAAHFVANGPAAAALGHGPIAVAEAAGSMGSELERSNYEAALVDQLAKAGYDTHAAASGGQTAELVITHEVIQPEEPPHNPVSGAVTLGTGNRGSWGGVAIAVDASKPAKALIATRLEVRIRDKASKEPLWEGHAQIVTREGDKHWTGQMIADRLAAALFKDFPRPS